MKEGLVRLNKFHYKLNSGLLFFIFSTSTFAALPEAGNFSLPTSQQLAPLVSLGQTIIGKYQKQINLYAQRLYWESGGETLLEPYFTYGISDKLTLQLTFPHVLQAQVQNMHSSGISDFEAQLEYAYFSKDTETYSQQATVLAEIIFPTGSSTKNPNTGIGTVGTMVGTTYSRTYLNWYGFVCLAGELNATHQGTHFGDEYFYEFGLGRIINAKSKKWIFAWLMELDGTYFTANTLFNVKNKNSGGNLIYLTPSLWYSTQRLILQGGGGLHYFSKFVWDPTKKYIPMGT